jgi:hypothetical protein
MGEIIDSRRGKIARDFHVSGGENLLNLSPSTTPIPLEGYEEAGVDYCKRTQ